jgi:hypothetical protein
MQLLTTADGTALVSEVTSAITANIPAVLVVLGAFIGLRVGAKLLNGGIKGKVRT